MKINKEDIASRIYYLDKNIKTLDWDDRHNQINPAKKFQLEEMKKEFSELTKKIE